MVNAIFKKIILLVLLPAVAPNQAFALSVGSNTVFSRQPIVTFPAAGTDNTMLGFAAFESGFRLQSSTTTCTYNDFYPIGGTVDMRGGRLYLSKDLVFNKSLNLTSSGSFFGSQYALEFDPAVTDLTLSPSLTFDNMPIVLNTNTLIHGPWQFRGECKISGRGRRLTLRGNSSIVVRQEGSLILEDMVITGLKANNLRCLNDSAYIELRNCTLILDRLFTFSQGSLIFDCDVRITGSNTFAYTTGLSSTINSQATLFIDQGTTFSCASRRRERTLLSFTDESSLLYLNGCTLYSTRTGLQLATGIVAFDNQVTITSEARNANEAISLKSSAKYLMLGGANVNVFGIVTFDA